MTKKKDGRKKNGGKRAGAGKPLKTGEPKKKITLRIYESHRAAIIARYGSLQAALDQIPTTK